MRKKELIEHLIHEHNVDICCLQETWTRNETKPVMRNFISFANNRSTGKGGGVAILVNHSLPCKQIKLQTEANSGCELLAVEVKYARSRLAIVSVYLAHPTIDTISAFDHSLKSLLDTYDEVLLCGDFNTHHYSWNHNHTTRNGQALQGVFTAHNLLLLNHPGTSTWHSSSSQASAVLDLTLCTPSLATRFHPEWRILDTALSDHSAILVSVHIVGPHDPPLPSISWQHPEDWKVWTDGIQDKLTTWLHDRQSMLTDIDDDYSSFVDLISSLARDLLGEKKRFTSSRVWWHNNTQVQAAIQASRRARRVYQKKRTSFSSSVVSTSRTIILRLEEEKVA